MGVAVTDAIQFTVAMIGCIVLAIMVVNSEQIGGIAKLKSSLPQGSLNFFPAFGTLQGNTDTDTIFSITAGVFLARIGLQWWSSWYPGAEPGGGGYVAQRMMSCRSEEDAVWATMFFQIAHYALRPWPWIIVGLCASVLYPELSKDQKELGFVFAMRDFLPHGVKGLLLAAFFAAYMSTISTQLNWGAGYLINDFFRRFIAPMAKERQLVSASRIATLSLMIIGLWVTTQLKTIESAWNFMIECGAGLGLVLILRWYWWRINAWSEIVATAAPFLGYSMAQWWGVAFPESFFFTVGFTTLSWLIATFVTKPEPEITLRTFYERVRPTGFWGILSKSGKNNYNHFRLLISWIASSVFVLCVLMLFGKLILQEWKESMLLASLALFSLTLLLKFYRSDTVSLG
jgi:Na+/proline symporter